MPSSTADHHHLQALSRIDDGELWVGPADLTRRVSDLATKDWLGVEAAICVPWKSYATARPREAGLDPVWSINTAARSPGGPVT